VEDFLPGVYMLWLHGGFRGVVYTYSLQTLSVVSVACICYTLVACINYTKLLNQEELLDAFEFGLPTSVLAWAFVTVMAAILVGLGAYLVGTVTRLWSCTKLLRTMFEGEPPLILTDYSWLQVLNHLSPKVGQPAEEIARDLTRNRAIIGAMVRAGMFTLYTGNMEIPYITYVLEWYILYVVQMVTENMAIPQSVVRTRLLTVIALTTLCSPCLLLMVVVYYIIRYGQFLRLSPRFLLSRHWSRYALWTTWAPTDMRHQVTERLKGLSDSADKFSTDVSGGAATICVALIKFYASLVCVCLLMLMVLRDDFVDLTLASHSLLWWVAIAASVYAACQSIESQDVSVEGKETALSTICRVTGLSEYMFRQRWSVLYEYRLLGFAKELVTMAALPAVLYFALYRRVHDIVQFIHEFK